MNIFQEDEIEKKQWCWIGTNCLKKGLEEWWTNHVVCSKALVIHLLRWHTGRTDNMKNMRLCMANDRVGVNQFLLLYC